MAEKKASGPESQSNTEKAEPEGTQLMVTRAILEETRQHLGIDPRLSDKQVLEWMSQRSGREILLVDELSDEEEVLLVCSTFPVVAGALEATCAECGVKVWHSRKAPQNAKKICTRCGPRLGH